MIGISLCRQRFGVWRLWVLRCWGFRVGVWRAGFNFCRRSLGFRLHGGLSLTFKALAQVVCIKVLLIAQVSVFLVARLVAGFVSAVATLSARLFQVFLFLFAFFLHGRVGDT